MRKLHNKGEKMGKNKTNKGKNYYGNRCHYVIASRWPNTDRITAPECNNAAGDKKKRLK